MKAKKQKTKHEAAAPSSPLARKERRIKARAMIAQGGSDAAIAAAVGMTAGGVNYLRKHPAKTKSTGKKVVAEPAPAPATAAPPKARTITASFFGDPPPGRSAADQRRVNGG